MCFLQCQVDSEKIFLLINLFLIRVVVFDHRKSTLAKIANIRQCPNNLILNIDLERTSAHFVFDYFSRRASEQGSLEVYLAHSFQNVSRLMQLSLSYNALYFVGHR